MDLKGAVAAVVEGKVSAKPSLHKSLSSTRVAIHRAVCVPLMAGLKGKGRYRGAFGEMSWVLLRMKENGPEWVSGEIN